MRKVVIYCLSFIFVILYAVGCAPCRGTAEVDPLSSHEVRSLRVGGLDTEYSSVLSDLEKAEDFDVTKYPTVKGDASLEIIQLAESLDGEVLVYVYQPGGNVASIVATEIRLSTTINEYLDYDDYKLTLLNSEETLAKYRIEGLTVSSSILRYYDVAQIARAWDSRYDKPVAGQNVASVPYKVGKRWEACTLDGVVYYNVVDVEVIEIEDKLVGYVYYKDGMHFSNTKACFAHFVAFSTDHDIDRLLAAQVKFVLTPFRMSLDGDLTLYKDKSEPKKVDLKYDQYAMNSGKGLFGRQCKWQRIQSAQEFSRNDALSSSAKTEIRQRQWVLNFYETEVVMPIGVGDVLFGGIISLGIAAIKGASGEVVTDVTVLELTFETDGQVYNMGAVDNKMAGSFMGTEKDTMETWAKIWAWLQDYWYVVLICFGAFVLLCVVLKLCFWIGSRR